MAVHLDFELAGTLDLTEVGTDVWTRHKDTQVILTGYAIDSLQPNAMNDGPLLCAVLQGADIHAWNAPFEHAVWNNIMVPREKWPPLPIERFHCTMAAATNAGLPMSLDAASEAVRSPHVKDKEGHALMKRMMRPRGFTANGDPRWWHQEDKPRLSRLIDYCLSDVEAERAVYWRIPRMSYRERQIWLADQRMNARGLPVDKDLLTALAVITQNEVSRLGAVLYAITRGAVGSTTQNTRILDWLRERGYPKDTLAKDTLTEFIGSPEFYALSQDVQDVLMVRLEAAKTSTAKLHSIEAYSQTDGKARNLVQYGGATRTLRWAGRGPQIQNFPRPVIKHTKEAIDEILKGLSIEGVRLLFGNPLDVVSSCLRGVFKAPPGYKFVVCDYHAIEAIVLAWLANFQELLDVFRSGKDVYAYTAESVGSSNRTLGKVLRLACGFGMGWVKFMATAASYSLILTPIEAQTWVDAFRAANQRIVGLWRAYENAARQAITYPGMTIPVGVGKVNFRMATPTGRVQGALLIEKPSGGTLVYRDAAIEDGRIVYWGVHQTTRQWCKIDTYGGKLVENVTQSVARDLLADVLIHPDIDQEDAVVALVHDEVVALTQEYHADRLFHILKTTMSQPPAWAAGMPLSAAGYVADRYSKT